MRKHNQKLKLLCLLDLLKNDTDEDHPFTTADICKKMNEMGIPCDRRTLKDDIKDLEDYGIEIMHTNEGHSKAYYIDDCKFTIPELKILIDSVQAASFITENKSNELTQKIAALSGKQRSQLLTENIIRFNTTKHTNEGVYYTVGTLEEAIRKHFKVSYLYFDLDENGDRAYRKKKESYVVAPIALIYNDDNYYMVCYTEKYDALNNYRLDRMEQVSIIKEPICSAAEDSKSNLTNHVEQSIHMYTGQTANVVLKLDNSLIGTIYDEFGEGTKMRSSPSKGSSRPPLKKKVT